MSKVSERISSPEIASYRLSVLMQMIIRAVEKKTLGFRAHEKERYQVTYSVDNHGDGEMSC